MDMLTEFKDCRLCHVEDCGKNNGGICVINAFFDDDNCKANRLINRTRIIKNYELIFDKHECFELAVNTSSKGAQRKWLSSDKKYFIKECFYYQLRYWNDDLVEMIASCIAEQLGIYHLEQHIGNISGIDCSYSEYWGDAKFISFGKLQGFDKIWEYKDAVDRIKYTADLMFHISGIDCTGYLADMTMVDFIVGNEDRHLYNFGILYDGNSYNIAPLFDCGLGLFEHDIDYKNIELEDSISRMSKKPFGAWDTALNYFYGIHNYSPVKKINVPKQFIPSNLAKQYLGYSLAKLGKELVLCD